MKISLEEEIRRSIWELHPLKSLGSNEFLGIFFCTYWKMLKLQIINFSKNILGVKAWLQE